ELTTSYRMIQGLLLNASISYTDAHLTEGVTDLAGAGQDGKSGDPLPYSPRLTASLTADYSRAISENKTLSFGGSYRYRDAVVIQFAHAYPEPIGPQNIVDLHAGLALQATTLRLYVTNVFNNQSYASLFYDGNHASPIFVPIQPRTIGISVDYQ